MASGSTVNYIWLSPLPSPFARSPILVVSHKRMPLNSIYGQSQVLTWWTLGLCQDPGRNYSNAVNLRVMLLLLRDRQRDRVRIREQTQRCLWSSGDLGPLVFPVCVPWEGVIHLHWEKLQNSSWTLKPETPASSTSPDTHASPFVYPVIRGGDQHVGLQHGAVCGAINSASAYWVERIAGHAAFSRLPLWQTSTVIPVCKVKRYFNIPWSQSDTVLIFIKAVYTCSKQLEANVSQGKRGRHIYTTMLYDFSNAVCCVVQVWWRNIIVHSCKIVCYIDYVVLFNVVVCLIFYHSANMQRRGRSIVVNQALPEPDVTHLMVSVDDSENGCIFHLVLTYNVYLKTLWKMEPVGLCIYIWY